MQIIREKKHDAQNIYFKHGVSKIGINTKILDNHGAVGIVVEGQQVGDLKKEYFQEDGFYFLKGYWDELDITGKKVEFVSADGQFHKTYDPVASQAPAPAPTPPPAPQPAPQPQPSPAPAPTPENTQKLSFQEKWDWVIAPAAIIGALALFFWLI